MQLVFMFFILILVSCGKDNVRRSVIPPEMLMREQQQQDEPGEQNWLVHPEIESLQQAEVRFTGHSFKSFSFNSVTFNKDILFHKKWIYQAKLQEEQDDRQYDFPIDQIDRGLNLVRLHSVNQSNSFRDFRWHDYSESQLSFGLKLNYKTARAITIRNIQIKLMAISSDFKRYEISEAPLMKYETEYEDLDLVAGQFTPSYVYQLNFSLPPEVMFKILAGKLWLGLYISNMEVEKEKEVFEFKDLWKKEFDAEKTWLKGDNFEVFEGKQDIKKLMRKIDSSLEYRNDGRIMSFQGRRSSGSDEWKVLKNGKASYISYVTNVELASFNDEAEILQEWENEKGAALVEVKGSVSSSSVGQSSQVLWAEVNKPRDCSRWTRYEKGECIDKDLSCHVTINEEVQRFSRKIEDSDIGINDMEKRGETLYGYVEKVNELELPENMMSSAVLGVVGIGHCPSQNEEGFKLPGFSPLNRLREVGLRYDLEIVVKKPATFQLWF